MILEASVPLRCLAVVLIGLCAGSFALAQESPPATDLLAPPGMSARPAEIRISDQVILVRDERMRQIHFTFVVHAGCLEEEPACRGIAHYLEHLILVGQNADHTEAAFRFFADGYANGWTNQKATAFVHRIAPHTAGGAVAIADLERLLAFYANRLRGFDVGAADAVRERNVVLQEYQLRTGNVPSSRFRVQFEKVLFLDHPLGQPVIGSPETIISFSLEEARRFHARWYASNNVTIVIAGNLDPEAVRALVARTLGTVEPRSLPLRPARTVPEVERGQFSLTVNDARVRGRTVRYAKLVRLPEETSLRSAGMLLSTFLASRLAGSPNDVLVEQQAVTDGISAGVAREMPGLYRFWLSAEPTPDTSHEQLADTMRRYLETLTKGGEFDPAILGRLKRRFAAEVGTNSLSGERILGRVVNWVANGDRFEDLSGFLIGVDATKPSDVGRLLAAFAGPGREVTGFLLPEADVQRRVP